MSKPSRTVTDQQRPPSDKAPHLVVALRAYGRSEGDYPLPLERDKFSLGSSQCDVLIADPHVSSLHCVLRRRGNVIEVHDHHSRNGTFLRGKREPLFTIGAGDIFKGRTKLIAMSDAMQAARPAVAELVGADEHVVIDDLVSAAAGEQPLAIFGEQGCWQPRLAQVLHRMSPHRAAPIVEEKAPPAAPDGALLLERAAHKTLVLPLAGKPLPDDLLSALLDPDRLRLIVTARSAAVALKAIG